MLKNEFHPGANGYLHTDHKRERKGRIRLIGRMVSTQSAAAGVDSLIRLKLGDARQEVPQLQGPFDFVFIDAWKQDYVRYLEMVVPLVPPGGVIVAHNVTNLLSHWACDKFVGEGLTSFFFAFII